MFMPHTLNLNVTSNRFFVTSIVSPVPMSDLHLWLRGDAGLVLDINNRVSQWTDMSGLNNHCIQPTEVYRPTLTSLGGRQALAFNDTWLDGVFSAGVVPQPVTVYAVANHASSASNSTVIELSASGETNNGVIVYKEGGNFSWRRAAAGNLRTVTFASDTNNNIFTLESDNAGGTAYQNGISRGALSGALTIPSSNTYVVGHLTGKFPGYWMVGTIAEILVYSATHSTATKNQIHQYLGTKYGITTTNL